ncbi:MAG: hypothetical protein AAGA70_11245 [Pseudomonadota bacterium]
MIRILASSATIALTAPPAMSLAEPWSCTFGRECIAGEPCEDTEWRVEIIAADHEGQLFLSSVTGDTPLSRIDGQSYAAPDTLVTIHAGGSALLSRHGDLTLSYQGRCEVLQ